MCLNCGCGEPETRHKATDITAEDVRQASGGKPLEETVQNLRTSLDQLQQSGGGQMRGGAMGSHSMSGDQRRPS